MQIPKRIKKLNRTLGNRFGFAYNRPRFAWVNSLDLDVPVPGRQKIIQRGGLWVVETVAEKVRQIEGPPRWLLARLIDPPTEAQWSEQFPTLPYPGQGYYVATDQLCKIGVEPTEELTLAVIGLIETGLATTEQQKRDVAENLAAADQRDARQHIDNVVEDAIPAFGNIPGTKEHVSFPGVI